MSRYISIFLLVILCNVILFFAIPVINYEVFAFDDINMSLTLILVLLGSFIITQLFYIINLLKKK